jgi:hypothetical protein
MALILFLVQLPQRAAAVAVDITLLFTQPTLEVLVVEVPTLLLQLVGLEHLLKDLLEETDATTLTKVAAAVAVQELLEEMQVRETVAMEEQELHLL